MATNIYHESVNDMADIKPGDMVMLKSGGPWLSVERAVDNPAHWSSEPAAFAKPQPGFAVVWFDEDDRIRRDTFPAACLVTEPEWIERMKQGAEAFTEGLEFGPKDYDA